MYCGLKVSPLGFILTSGYYDSLYYWDLACPDWAGHPASYSEGPPVLPSIYRLP